MKIKKIAAALTASALLCGALAIPANAAAPAYEKGDVNMDGKIDASDAMLVLDSFCVFCVADGTHITGHYLTEEQLMLADVVDTEPTVLPQGITTTVNALDAQAILQWFNATNMEIENVTFENAWQFCG